MNRPSSFARVVTILTIILLAFASTASRAASPLIVNSPDDAVDINPGDGMCETGPANGVCTLRAAIQEANALPGDDTITLPAGVYTLTIAGPSAISAAAIQNGDLDIEQNLVINGANAATTIIRGGENFNGRIINVSASATASIFGVTIEGGRVTGSGGGVSNAGNLSINNSAIRSNFAGRDTNLKGGQGGGIRNTGTLAINGSVISGNTASDDGGGLYNAGTLSLSNVTISGNTARGDTDGNGDGGGLYNAATMTTTPIATITFSTIAFNTAIKNGGGVRNNNATIRMDHTILADNSAASSPNCSGAIISNGSNLDSGNSCRFTGSGDLINTAPRLGPLAYNGGPTQTHALLNGSPAIDAADPASCIASDQRGVTRPKDGNGDGVAACDLGAYEFDPAQPPQLSILLPLVRK